MGGDHGHDHGLKIPDYRVYKIENSPELLKVQKDLAALGLKDPWLRNEIWRYDVTIWGKRNFLSTWGSTVFRGSMYGLGAAVLTVALSAGYRKLMGKEDNHDHGAHH